jgi:hypothetical protein
MQGRCFSKKPKVSLFHSRSLMSIDPRTLANDPTIVENVEKASTRLVCQAILDFALIARDQFLLATRGEVFRVRIVFRRLKALANKRVQHCDFAGNFLYLGRLSDVRPSGAAIQRAMGPRSQAISACWESKEPIQPRMLGRYPDSGHFDVTQQVAIAQGNGPLPGRYGHRSFQKVVGSWHHRCPDRIATEGGSRLSKGKLDLDSQLRQE